MRAMGDKSSARLVNELRCLYLYFAKRRDAHFKSPRAFAGSDSAVRKSGVGLEGFVGWVSVIRKSEGSVQTSRFALWILRVTELWRLRGSLWCCCLSVCPHCGVAPHHRLTA